MNFNLPEVDDERMKRLYAQKLEEMLANRKGEIPELEPEIDDREGKIEALRGLAGEYDYSDMELGEQPNEDILAPDIVEEAPIGNPIMEDDKLANIEKLKKLLGK